MTSQTDAYAKVIERSLTDPAFRRQLVGDPAATLRSAGVALPDGVSVKVVEDTDTLVHVVLPALVPAGATSDRELEKVAGGVTTGACYRGGGGGAGIGTLPPAVTAMCGGMG